MLELVGKRGWEILNGKKTGDDEGELIYVGQRGQSIIMDDSIVNEKPWEGISQSKAEERIDFEHIPLEIEIEEYDRKQEKDEEKVGKYVRIRWGVKAQTFIEANTQAKWD